MSAVLTPEYYPFHQLTPDQFEDLACDVVHQVYGTPLLKFAKRQGDQGRDASARGVSLRLSRDGKLLENQNVVIQAKHTEDASAKLNHTVRRKVFGKESDKVKKLVEENELDIYFVVTNYSIPGESDRNLTDKFKHQGAQHVVIIGRETLFSMISNDEKLITIIPLKYGIGDLTQRDTYQMRKQSLAQVEYYERELLKSFIATKAFEETIKSVANDRHNVIILDGPQSGKSTILRKLGSDVERSTTYDFSECVCATFDEFKALWNPGEKQVFIVDDVFGNQEFNEREFQVWNQRCNSLSAATYSNSPSSFVFASRNEFYQCALSKANNDFKNVLAEAILIDLEEETFKLNLETKKSILLKHIDVGDNESDVKDELIAILRGENLESIVSGNYPLFLRAAARIALKKYTANADLSFDWVQDFFKEHGTSPSTTEGSATSDQSTGSQEKKAHKVWTGDRKVRVLAGNLQELKIEGGKKLGFKVAEITEEDGTEVDDETFCHLDPGKPLYFSKVKFSRQLSEEQSRESSESSDSEESGGSADGPRQDLEEQVSRQLSEEQSRESSESSDSEESGGSADGPQQDLEEQEPIHILHNIISARRENISSLDQQASLTEEERKQIWTSTLRHLMATSPFSPHSSGTNAYCDQLTARTGAVPKKVSISSSLIIAVECPSPEALHEFWAEFRCGDLNKMANECLIPEEVKSTLGYQEIELTTAVNSREPKDGDYTDVDSDEPEDGDYPDVDSDEPEDGDYTEPLYTFNELDEAVFIKIAASVVIEKFKIPLLSISNAQVAEPQLVSRDENSHIAVLVEHNKNSANCVEMEMAKEVFQKVKTKLKKAAKHVRTDTLVFATNQDISSTQKKVMMGLFAEGTVIRQLCVLDRNKMLEIIEKSHDLHASVQQEWICKQIQKDHEKVEMLQKRTTPALKEEGPVMKSEGPIEETIPIPVQKVHESSSTELPSEEGLSQRKLAEENLQPKREKASTSKAEFSSEPTKRVAREKFPATKKGPWQKSRAPWLVTRLEFTRAQKCAGCKKKLSASVAELCVRHREFDYRKGFPNSETFKEDLRTYHLNPACIARRHDDFNDPKHMVVSGNKVANDVVLTDKQRNQAEQVLGKVVFGEKK